MKEKLRLFIESNLELEKELFRKARVAPPTLYSECCIGSIDDYINENKEDNKFQKLLFKLIDERDLKDSDVYNKVHIDRRLFHKIRNDNSYHPSKETILLLGFSMELSILEMEQLLDSASYSLPKNNSFDLIIRYCFVNQIYNIYDVNELLDKFNCELFNY